MRFARFGTLFLSSAFSRFIQFLSSDKFCDNKKVPPNLNKFGGTLKKSCHAGFRLCSGSAQALLKPSSNPVKRQLKAKPKHAEPEHNLLNSDC